MSLEHLTQSQLKQLVLYHAANARFHNTQVALLREVTQPEMGHDNVFEPLAQHHERMAAKHQDVAEGLNSRLGTTQSVNLE
jgi:hypothetical protein